MQLILRTYNLHLQHTFRISRQSYNEKRVLIVELKDGTYSGYGEASENPYYHKKIEDMILDLSHIKTLIENISEETPEQFWDAVYPLLQKNMFALCALDMAYHDLYARKKRKKLYQLWDYKINPNIISNFTIGIDTIDNMILKMEETPWPIYKIKLGTKEDLAIVKALREHTEAIFRIDANGSWEVEETVKNSFELKNLGVEFLEQPLAADDFEGNQYVFKHAALPIIADESCQIEADIETCHQSFHGVNIKLVKCGGLTPAKRMIERSKSLHMKTMVGCMTESSIGISAIAHLAPVLDYVDMDGAMLLRDDIASGVTLKKGKIVYTDINGTGALLLNNNPISIIK